MSNKKNKENKERLTRHDRERSSDSAPLSANNNFIEKYTKARGNVSSVFSKKSKFPIGLDIFISILLIVLVAALVVGAYFLIISFDDAYQDVTVDYVLLVDKAQASTAQRDMDLYVDKDGSAVHLGKITAIDDKVTVSGVDGAASEYVAITVRANLQFRDDEGFSIDDVKIAVGNAISVRVKNVVLNCEIVDLAILEVKGK